MFKKFSRYKPANLCYSSATQIACGNNNVSVQGNRNTINSNTKKLCGQCVGFVYDCDMCDYTSWHTEHDWECTCPHEYGRFKPLDWDYVYKIIDNIPERLGIYGDKER